MAPFARVWGKAPITPFPGRVVHSPSGLRVRLCPLGACSFCSRLPGHSSDSMVFPPSGLTFLLGGDTYMNKYQMCGR